jgi:5'-3' exonuclease
MGIKSLSKFLHDNFPELFEQVHISEYAYERVCVDISLYLCNYKALYGDEWLGAFVKLITSLRQNNVHCVFVYDTGSPPEKAVEKEERQEKRRKVEERVSALEEAIEKYYTEKIVEPILLEFQEQRGLENVRMLKQGQVSVNINAIENAVKKMRKQLFNITQKDFETTRELFDIMRVPYYNAPLEAETMGADLCKRGMVHAVLTEDTDVLAYGAPVFLTKYNVMSGTCFRVKYQDLLKRMGLTPEQFLDFCIMCGTDYNKNIFRVGPAKAYKLIQEYGNIEDIALNTSLDISVLNHVRTRELFTDYEQAQIKITYCGKPNFGKLQEFLFKKNIKVDISSLERNFTSNIIFEE